MLKNLGAYLGKSDIQAELKRRRKSVRKRLPLPSAPPLSTAEEPVPVLEGVVESSGDPMEAMEDFPVPEVPEPSNKSPSKKSLKKCASCRIFTKEKRKLNNPVKMLQLKLKDRRRELSKIKRKLKRKSCSVSIYVSLFL